MYQSSPYSVLCLTIGLASTCRLSQPASLAPLATRLNAIYPLRLPSPLLTCLRVSAIEDTVSRGVAKETVSSRCCCFVWLRNVSPCRPVVLPIDPQHRLFVCSARHASSSSHTAHTTRHGDAKEAFHLSDPNPALTTLLFSHSQRQLLSSVLVVVVVVKLAKYHNNK